MKSFIFSVVILVISIILVAVNHIFVTGYLSEVVDSLNKLPQGFEVISGNEIEEYAKNSLEIFEQHSDFMSFSINARDLRDMHGYLSELYAAASCTDEASYSTALYKALTFAQNLLLRETFSFKNII